MIAFLKAARKEHNLRQKRAREGAQKVKSAVEQAAGRSASFMDASKALAADATCRGIFYKRRTSMRRFKFYAPVDEAALAEAGFIVQPGPSYYDFCRLVFVPREAERRITNDVVNVPIAEWFLSRPRHRIKRAP
jgi:hypothetical protein